MKKERRRRFGLGSRLLLIPAGLLAGLLIAEIALRLMWSSLEPPADVHTSYNFIEKPFAGRGFFNRRNSTFESTYDGDPCDALPDDCIVTYRLNEVGFRDEAMPPNGRRGKPLVAVIGDSFVFGLGVSREDRFTNVCERALGGDARVLNLGVAGYSSEDEHDLALAILHQLQPDIVVVAYCLNDPVHPMDVDYDEYFGFDLIMRRDRVLVSFQEETSPLYLVRLARQRFQTHRIDRKATRWYLSMYEGDRSPWTRSREYLQEIRRISNGLGAETALFVMPLFNRLDDYALTPIHEEIARWAGEVEFPMLDTLPLFEGQDDEDLIVHPKDRHPNAKAHRVFGKALAKFLRKRFLD